MVNPSAVIGVVHVTSIPMQTVFPLLTINAAAKENGRTKFSRTLRPKHA